MLHHIPSLPLGVNSSDSHLNLSPILGMALAGEKRQRLLVVVDGFLQVFFLIADTPLVISKRDPELCVCPHPWVLLERQVFEYASVQLDGLLNFAGLNP